MLDVHAFFHRVTNINFYKTKENESSRSKKITICVCGLKNIRLLIYIKIVGVCHE